LQFTIHCRQYHARSVCKCVSAANLRDDEFVGKALSLVSDHNIEPGKLVMEITESDLVEDLDRSLMVLKQFEIAGYRFSIDDYGTGYSSLAQLKNLPVDELKIDRTFIHQLMTDPDDQLIVKSTIDLAHGLGLRVVAEGVEDKQILSWIMASGCDSAQGFYISKPLPAEQLETWLACGCFEDGPGAGLQFSG